jgi:hypothetical protein
MYRSVLEHKGFIRWSQEGVIAFVAHNELGHEEVKETDSYGKEVRRCTLYPGLSCRDHLDAAVDIDNARGDDLVKVPFLELCPNTWLVAPSGEVTQVPETSQFDPAKIQEQVAALQKTLGEPVPTKAWPGMQDLATKADAALDEDRLQEGLLHLAALGKSVKEPHAALKAFVQARLDDVDEDVTYAFEDLRDDAKLAAADKRAKVEALLAAVDVEVLGARLPVHGAMKAWLAN